MGIWARGSNSRELLEGLALGLYALMTDLRKIRPREERAVSASAEDPSGLVVAFLTQLLLLKEADGFIGREVRVHPVGTPPTAIVASLTGEPFDPDRHVARVDVKAVTLHRLVFDVAGRRARVIVDI